MKVLQSNYFCEKFVLNADEWESGLFAFGKWLCESFAFFFSAIDRIIDTNDG